MLLREPHCGKGTLRRLMNFGSARTVESSKRGVHRIQVVTKDGLPLQGDIEMILRRHCLDFPQLTLVCRVGDSEWHPPDVLHQLAKDEGLKAICERLRYTHRFARQSGRDAIT